MHIMMITHVGDTVGHVVRGLALADALTAEGARVEFAVDPRSQWLFDTWPSSYRTHCVRWDFSHNAFSRTAAPDRVLTGVVNANRDLLSVLESSKPDLALGFPGIFSFQACRALGIPHSCVMHGPYLSPLLDIPDASPAERAVLDLTSEILLGGAVDQVLVRLSTELGLPEATTRRALAEEAIICPQPGLPFALSCGKNVRVADYIAASYGPPPPAQLSQDSEVCYVTFGSGNPCDVSAVARCAADVYRTVLVSPGDLRLEGLPDNVVVCRAVASQALVGRVSAVISHGGIGTVGTFAQVGTPQLVIPTEPDQATMAVHGTRHGVAIQCGLEEWSRSPQTGRRLPVLETLKLRSAVEQMRDMNPAAWTKTPARGATEIAALVMSGDAVFGLAS